MPPSNNPPPRPPPHLQATPPLPYLFFPRLSKWPVYLYCVVSLCSLPVLHCQLILSILYGLSIVCTMLSALRSVWYCMVCSLCYVVCLTVYMVLYGLSIVCIVWFVLSVLYGLSILSVSPYSLPVLSVLFVCLFLLSVSPRCRIVCTVSLSLLFLPIDCTICLSLLSL